MNRERPHLYVLPEDDANRQIANGFQNHPAVNRHQMQILQPSGGWKKVISSFEDTHIRALRKFPDRSLVLIIDFDGIGSRLADAQTVIPEDLKNRVFILGARTTPEKVKRSIPQLHSFEQIGRALAEDCESRTQTTWSEQELDCNLEELERMQSMVRPFLFS